jgi:hypothetical protein
MILITIISCDYLNLSLADEYVGNVTIPTQVIEYSQNFLQAIIQSDLNIQIKLNYIKLISVKYLLIRKFRNYQTKTSVAVPSQDLDF